MSRAGWVKHALVFVGAIVMVWLSGVVPVLILKPGPYAGMSDAQVFSEMGRVDLGGVLRAWPIYIAIAICQALTFHYVKRFATPVFLLGVFVVGAIFAWRFWSAMS